MKQKVSELLIIKKYENRRLYNTLTSQYINREQVAQLVRDGCDVRVVDATTGEDLTRLTLAQIVLEDAKTPDSRYWAGSGTAPWPSAAVASGLRPAVPLD